jgi:hypothetical protein
VELLGRVKVELLDRAEAKYRGLPRAREKAGRREITEERGLRSLRSFWTWLREVLEADTVWLAPFFCVRAPTRVLGRDHGIDQNQFLYASLWLV